MSWTSLVAQMVKDLPACKAGDLGSIAGLRRFLRRREWQSTPVVLPGQSHGQGSLADYSPWMESQRVGYD